MRRRGAVLQWRRRMPPGVERMENESRNAPSPGRGPHGPRTVTVAPGAFPDAGRSAGNARDGEHSLPKPPGTYRILALGDSFTFGWGVQARDTWWARLGRLMAHRMSPVPVEMINLGVYFYTFDQQVQRLQELGLALSSGHDRGRILLPARGDHGHAHIRMATLETVASDFDSTIYVDAEGLLRSGRPVPFEDLRRHSALADFALSRYKRIRYSFSPAGRLHEFGLLGEDQEGKFRHLWDLTR